MTICVLAEWKTNELLYEYFGINLPKCYSPGENVTADEQLVAFRWRFPLKQIIPSTYAKYAWNMQYTGKLPGEQPKMRVIESFSAKLTMKIFDLW